MNETFVREKTNTSIITFVSDRDHAEILSWVIVTAVICTVGCFNNLVMLTVTWPGRKTSQKSGLNLLVFHFVLTNLFSCFINIPIKVIMVQAKQSFFHIPVVVCNYTNTLHLIGWLVVNAADATLALNRCIALYLPLKYQNWSTNSVNMAIITVVWLLSSGTIVPIAFGVGGSFRVLPSGQCGFRPLPTAFGSFLAMVTYIPLLVILVASCLILYKIYDLSRRPIIGLQPTTLGQVMVRRLKMAKILLVTFLWGLVFNVAFALLNYAFPYVLVRLPQLNLWLLTTIAVQYSFAPCILLIFNGQYREPLQKAFHRARHRAIEPALSNGTGSGAAGSLFSAAKRSTVLRQFYE